MNVRHPGERLIESREGVCGGAACIRGTRIPVWMLHLMHTEGATEEELMQMYHISQEALTAAWKYAEKNRDEIADRIAQNQAV